MTATTAPSTFLGEHAAPLLVPPRATSDVNRLLARRIADDPASALAETSSRDGWVPVSATSLEAQVAAAAKRLVARGVRPGEPVGMMSRTRSEWTPLDFAARAAGAVPGPVYETSSREQVEWILRDSGAGVLLLFLTPKQSVRRGVLLEDFAAEVEGLCTGGGGPVTRGELLR